jgi:hypothetical protein
VTLLRDCIAHVVASGSLLVDSPVLFAVAGYEWRRARLTSKLPGVSILADCH